MRNKNIVYLEKYKGYFEALNIEDLPQYHGFIGNLMMKYLGKPVNEGLVEAVFSDTVTWLRGLVERSEIVDFNYVRVCSDRNAVEPLGVVYVPADFNGGILIWGSHNGENTQG